MDTAEVSSQTTSATWLSELTRIDDAIRADQPAEAIGELLRQLRWLKRTCQPAAWTAAVQALRGHPIHQAILASPISGRAFRKPRGYAGDAVLLDAIYGMGPRARGVSSVGHAVCAVEYESHATRSTRARKARLAREFDRAADRHGLARVLSLACGHLREVECSEAAQNGRLRIVAVDQDADSVGVVAQAYAHWGVAARTGTVGDALKGRFDRSAFHLVYAAGLYDYLEARLATALTLRLFQCVAPGGHLLIPNFTPDFLDIAYLEACQDWHLLYRDETQMRELLAAVPENEIAAVEQFREDEGAITYLRVTRR